MENKKHKKIKEEIKENLREHWINKIFKKIKGSKYGK